MGIRINRVVFLLSLAGMVLTVHLWIQQSRGFDQGCLGLSRPAPTMENECREIANLPASHLLGIPNAAWGYAFYLTLSLISFVRILTTSSWGRRLHTLREGLVAVALLYSGYLVYQMGFVAHAWCILCTASATLIAILFALHVRLRVRNGPTLLDEDARTVEFRVAIAGLFAATGVLVGIVTFVDRLGTRPLSQGAIGNEIERIVGDALPVYIDAQKLQEMRACHFDWDAPTLSDRKFPTPTTPFIGHLGSPEVIVFYDPNCPHCKAYHPTFLRLMEKFRDRARFTIVPRLLWDESIPQLEALKLAENSGKYFELWQRMFAAQGPKRKPMTPSEIAAIFRDLDMDIADLPARLASVRPAVIAARRQAQAAGIDGVPTIYVGGRKVWDMNYSEDCLGKLIERSANNAAKSATTAK